MLCSGSAQQFCALTNTVLVWYVVGFGSSVLVCLGLVQFIVSNASNYSHISGERRFSELQDIFLTESYSLNDAYVNSYDGGKMPTNKLNKYPVKSTNTIQQRNYQTTHNNLRRQKCFVSNPPTQFSYLTQPNPVGFMNGSRDALNCLPTRKSTDGAMNMPFRNTNSVGKTINASRRNSYHNSFRDSGEYKDFTNMMY